MDKEAGMLKAGNKVKINLGKNKGKIATVIGVMPIGNVRHWVVEFENGKQDVFKESALEIIKNK